MAANLVGYTIHESFLLLLILMSKHLFIIVLSTLLLELEYFMFIHKWTITFYDMWYKLLLTNPGIWFVTVSNTE